MFKSFNRKKIGFFFIIVYILGIFIIVLANNYIFNLINREYINQNTAIVGALSKSTDLDNTVIPVITKGYNKEDLDLGKNILKKYSYTNKLDKGANKFLYKTYKKSIIIFIGIWSFFLIIIYLYINKFSSFIFDYLEKLTRKAENVVEGKFSAKERNQLEDERLNKLENQFYLMEQRVKRSIDDLKAEKSNLKDIIDDISHQLKTPLAALIMYNEILSDSEDIEETKYFNDLTKEQLGRMEWLIMTLLKYAKLECNAVAYNKVNKSLKKTIENSIESLEYRAESKNQRMIFNCEKDVSFLHDRKWLEEALINIIKNGLEHSKDEGIIEISLKETELFATVEIRDFGEGIDKEEIKHIFKRFFKGKSSNNPQSIGIGLALSKSIIEANNGTIKVESELDKGTIFKINFIKM